MRAHHFLGLQRHHPPVILCQRYENQLQDLLEGPKEVETINQSRLSETKADAFSTW